MMSEIFSVLLHYIDFYPLVALLGLLLAGLNLPVSEDLIIITSALVCHKKPSLMPETLAALYFGIIATDFFMYWVGTRVRKGTGKIKIISRLFQEKTLTKMHYYMNKYGIFTFIVGRFIPFGVRNALFFSSGFFGLKFKSFIIYDLTAAMVSINTLFFLVYCFGEVISKPIKIAGIILFIALVSAIISLVIRFIVIWRRGKVSESN